MKIIYKSFSLCNYRICLV